MESYEIVYDRAISDIEEIIKNELIELPEEQKINFNEVQTVESNLDAWDYCFALAIGLAGVTITSSKMFSKYLNDIHKAASGQKGDFSFFQEFLGDILKHKGDFIDKADKTFKNRFGKNAYGLFHRLLWGHDILAVGKDNPFALMIKQKGWFGIIQAFRHLLADTMSKQGLPAPGSSFLDYIFTDETGKAHESNYLIKIAQSLSEEAFGNKANAQEVYAHLATIRFQDISGGVVVRVLSEAYIRARKIEDKLRCVEIKFIAYAVSFFGEAVVGMIRQKGIPYINIPVATAMTKEFLQFCVIDAAETHKLYKTTDEIIKTDDDIIGKYEKLNQMVPKYISAEDCFESLNQTESNIDNLILFLGECE